MVDGRPAQATRQQCNFGAAPLGFAVVCFALLKIELLTGGPRRPPVINATLGLRCFAVVCFALLCLALLKIELLTGGLGSCIAYDLN